MTEFNVTGPDVVIVAVIVWFLGSFLNKKIRVLDKFNIPVAVTGGLLCSILVALAYNLANIQINFDSTLRDLMILTFFSTIGLTAKFRLLASGGRTLLILLVLAAILLILQDIAGMTIAWALGANPAYGLFGGSVSFAGGFGTAVAWGNIAEKAGLSGAGEIGIIFATIGLILGGVIGGPVSGYLIKKNKLEKSPDTATTKVENSDPVNFPPVGERVKATLGTLLILAICVQAGDTINDLLSGRGITLPGFLTAMIVAIIFTNLADLTKRKLSDDAIEMAQEISLQLFLCISLMSMQLWILANALGPVLLVAAVQTIVIVVFSLTIVFRSVGSDYDASVIVSGFIGMGLGATPVGIANMNAVTGKFGPSPRAYILVPLVGAFFIDLINATVIQLFLELPFIQVGG